MIRLTASPTREVPGWAVLERELFRLLDGAWRTFADRFTVDDGRLRYAGRMYGRDGVDDFYEPFFNWPVLYRLGGSADLLRAAKRHWEGVTRQLTEFGFVRDEYERGYDWFHQGESLPFFLSICAADPADSVFRARAERFAELYLPGSAVANYDAARRIIVAPHTGSDGPRYGLGEEWAEYRADQEGMRLYGLPLHDLPGIDEWVDLHGEGARRMGEAMRERMGRGDTAVNLAATSLAANAWLYDNDPRFSDWLLDYVDAWRERASANDGILPDNVGPGGVVGEQHGGAWYGGHYGWTWPHGLHSIAPAALVAALNATLVTGDMARLDLARGPLDAVLAHAEVGDRIAEKGSLGPGWAERLGADASTRELLVPYRHGPSGWFDRHPVPLAPLLWLRWISDDSGDAERLDRVRRASTTPWHVVRWFHDKEEQGHEAPWIEYLAGRNPDYPERALELAIGQVLRRLALIAEAPDAPDDGDIHFWQRLNPVVTEVLAQLVTGAPPAVYYGGLGFARVAFADEIEGRPGLPAEVAALVSRVDAAGVDLELVNLGAHERRLLVTAGAFAEDRIDAVTSEVAGDSYPGDPHRYDIPELAAERVRIPVGEARLAVVLPPRSRLRLELEITRRAFRAVHQDYVRITQENR